MFAVIIFYNYTVYSFETFIFPTNLTGLILFGVTTKFLMKKIYGDL